MIAPNVSCYIHPTLKVYKYLRLNLQKKYINTICATQSQEILYMCLVDLKSGCVTSLPRLYSHTEYPRQALLKGFAVNTV